MSNVKCQMSNAARGFALIELLVVIGIIAILFGISTVSLLSVRNKASLSTTVSAFINDGKSQQTKAMIGDSEGRSSHDSYGLYIEQNRYTLFHGTSFSATDPDNFAITLTDDLKFANILFPSSQIIFSSVSGELANFTSGTNSLTIQNINDNSSKTIEINRYGVITAIN
ncbi:MAG: prepilin-type N-terminal cleavage/methylation domain-containing protein [Candidatus Levybacteria bacterium]|nr:prepilin-type N-terminal cleavage/methylation domain-containing protein [Candidatus Levybacteria bacterium]